MKFKYTWRSVIAVSMSIILLTAVLVGNQGILIQADSVVRQQNIAKILIDENGKLNCTIESNVTKESMAANKLFAYESQGKYYFLLPSFLNLEETEIKLESSTNETVLFDGKSQGKLEKGDLSLGNHILSFQGKSYEIIVKQSAKVTSMFITTDDPLEYIHSSKKNKTTGNMTLVTNEGQLEFDGGLTQIKTRGNSTFYDKKKPYQIKLSKAADLLGLGSGKTWILLANAYDESSIRNKLVFDMAQAVGLSNNMSSDWVDLYINGEYHGNYLLSEKIEIAKNRVDIKNLEKETEAVNSGVELSSYTAFGKAEGEKGKAKGVQIPNNPSDITGGYLLEVEASSRYAEESSGFVTKRNQPVVIKSPEYASSSQANYILDVFQKFEDALYAKDGINPNTGKSYEEYFDMTSFVKRYIIDEISRNVDAGVTSSFFYKPEGEDSLVYSGPCWDYDTALGRAWGDFASAEGLGYPYFTEDYTANWYEALYRFPEFKKQIRSIYNETFRPVLEEMLSTGLANYADTLQESLTMNEVRWPVDEDKIGFEEDYKVVLNFLTRRIEWLNKTWLPITPEEMATPTPTKTPSVSPSVQPTLEPTKAPSVSPSVQPTLEPTKAPSVSPSVAPTLEPTKVPSTKPVTPSPVPSVEATSKPTTTPSPKVTLTKKSATLYTKGLTTLHLKYNVFNTKEKPVFRSSNTKVAVVDKNGKVTAKKKGNAIITASVKGASSTCKITVKQPTLSVSKSKLVVKKNKTVSINAKATPTKTITYKSNNKKIATVTKDGKVKGLRSGTTEIFVSCNGVTKKIMITVVK